LQIVNKKWTGDFDRMLERRTISVAAPYSRTLYYNDSRERGARRGARPRFRALDQPEVCKAAHQPPADRLHPPGDA
jgi:hypothetical protein